MKIVIVGGVAGGASAAARARRLDEHAEILVFERGGYVSFANCGLPYHISGAIKDRKALLLQTPRSLQAMLNLEVRVGAEVTAIDRDAKSVTVKMLETGATYAESYDKLVLCPGAAPIRPELPGIDLPGIHVLRNVADMDVIKAAVDGGARDAVVIGGGYIGVEMAESLVERGLKVHLVEMMPQLMPPLDREMARDLEKHMAWKGVGLHLGTAAAAFRAAADKRLAVELVDGVTLAADFVVLAAGVRPDSALAAAAGLAVGARGGIKVNENLQTSDPDIYAAGDAIEVVHSVTGEHMQIPLAGPANRQGRSVADHIYGRKGAYTNTKGTAVVKVFDMTAGGTGATEKSLRKAGVPYRKVYLHPSGHAGYYPGTAPMHIKVIFAPDDGKLLGAQVVGFDGVDKRLDVFATALCAGMTVYDLKEIELAYAPPYGSAKDPVNMAGLVAGNLLDGDLELWDAEDFPEKTAGGLILDVRSPQEYETWHVPGAMNLPVTKLRESLDQLPHDRPIYTYCRVGFRSYLAYRILKQRGFARVASLSGGTMTFCSYHGSDVCSGQPEPVAISYAETQTADVVQPVGATIALDLCGLQCPGPIRELAAAMAKLKSGDELVAKASDPGFAADGPMWAQRQGHAVVSVKADGPNVTVAFRKGSQQPCRVVAGGAPALNKKTMVVFSGDLDKVLASFIIANGAASMGNEVTMFFTFWGLNALRKSGPQAAGKGIIDRMFGWMLPKGANALKLSQMHMAGMGTAMMKHVMQSKRVDSLPKLMQFAQAAGVKFVACTMSMDVMGIKREELIDGIELGGVAAFLGESDEANMTLFI